MNYQSKKQSVRKNVIDITNENNENSMFWSEVIEQTAKFEKLAKRYGLIREFKENGLI
jgi:hypothetical protein